jgi:hypothetical protein
LTLLCASTLHAQRPHGGPISAPRLPCCLRKACPRRPATRNPVRYLTSPVPAPPSHPHVRWTLDSGLPLHSGRWTLVSDHSPRRTPPSALRTPPLAPAPTPVTTCHQRHRKSLTTTDHRPAHACACRPAVTPACRHRSHHPTAPWRLVTHKPSSWRGSTFTSSLRSVPFSAQRRGSTEATTRSPHNWACSAHPLALIHT